MKRQVLLVIFMFFFAASLLSQAPAWIWAKDANSTSYETAWDVAYDANSTNIYAGGSFFGNLSSVYGSGLASPYGSSDGFLAKYDQAGNVLWAIKIGGTNNDEVHGVACDGSGNVYVTGFFNGTADFDPSLATYTLTSSGNADGFLAKYSSAGALIWATKFGGTNDEYSWKMSADANGVYITGSYESTPATFYSYGSATTKTTSIAAAQLNTYGAKYNSSGVVQWVVSGGSSKDDTGFSVVADGSYVYFIGRYDSDLNFKDASGTTSATLQAQNNNKPQVYILSVSQAGAFSWQNNITASTGGDMVVGWSIAQDASNLYVTGYFDGNINFKYPTPTLTQSLTSGGSVDLFLAQISKTGTFNWNTSATGNGPGDQIGRALEVDASGNIVLGGVYSTTLNYSGAGGPGFSSAGLYDVFVSGYTNTGSFLYSTKAGGGSYDYLNGLSVDNAGGIYVCGEEGGSMVAGTTTLQSGGGSNVFVAKLGCSVITNNTITATQTICAGSAPATFTGSAASGGTIYLWQTSANNSTWTPAPGTFTNQNYSAPTQTAVTYFRRVVSSTGSCTLTTSNSNTITVSVISPPSTAVAGINQSVCAASSTLSATSPTSGTGQWTVIGGTASVTTSSSFSSQVTGLSVGTNTFVWTVSNAPCANSTSTVIMLRYAVPSSNAGVTQTVCSTTATLAAVNPTIGTGVWSVLSGTASLTSSASYSSPVTSLSIGSNQFVWTVTNGNCTAATSTVTIIQNSQPTANAGTNQAVCSSSLNLAAVSTTIGTGSWSQVSGTGTISAVSNPSTLVTGIGFGATQFVWTVSNFACTSATSTVTIIRDIPPSANAGTLQSVCSATVGLSAVIPTVGVGSWSVITGSATVNSPASYSSQATSLSAGANQFLWTVTGGACPSATSVVTINRDLSPTANAGNAQTVCASAATLAATSPAIGTGLWSVLSGTASVTASSSNTSAVTGLSNGNNSFVWTVSNGVCPAATATVIINRDIQPVSNAGINQTVCASSTVLAAVSPTAGNGLWSVLSGTASITTPSNNASSVSGLSNGLNSFVWTVSNGTCTAATSTLTITRDIQPTASAGPNQTICASAATLAATSPTVGSGIWSVLSGTASVTTSSNNTSPVTGLSNGSNSFVWTVSNGVCTAATATVIINRNIQPVSNAGVNQTVCASSTVLAAVSPTTGNGLWSVLSGTASITTPSNNASSVSGLSNGLNSFVWTVSNGTCTAATSTLTIFREAQPTSNAGISQTVCSGTATLSAQSSTPGTGFWSLFSGSGTLSSSLSAATQVSALGFGLNSFVWTVSNGSCPIATSTVSISNLNPPTANAGTDQALCSPETTLAASIPSSGNGLWSVSQGTAAIATPTDPLSPVTALGTGTTILLWTVSNGSCPTATSVVMLTQDIQPQAFAGNNQTLCSNSVTLSATNPTLGSGSWSLISGAGSIATPTLPVATATALGIGQNYFIWSVTNGVCPPATSTVIISRDTLPGDISAGTDFTVCSSSCTMAALYTSPGIASWSIYAGNASITSSVNPNSGIINLSSGLNQFIFSNTNGSCPPAMDTVAVFFTTPLAPASAGSDQEICSTECTLSANNAGSGNWTVLSGNASIGSSTSAVTTVSDLTTGINTFIWTVTQAFCPSTSDTVSVLRNENLGTTSAGADQVLCGSEGTLMALPPASGQGVWKNLENTSVIGDTHVAQTLVQQLSPGVNTFVWTVTNANCPALSDTVYISSDAVPSAAMAGKDLLVCQDVFTLEASVPTIGSGKWISLTGNGTFQDSKTATTTISGLQEGMYVLMWTVSNGVCPTNSDTVKITRTSDPIVPEAGAEQIIETSSAQLNANIPQAGIGTWSVIAGSCEFSNIHDSNAVISKLPFGATILRWTIANKSCPDVSDDITVNVKNLNIPNAFSPNGDGINDKFTITSLDYYENVKISVFNRWGTLLYHNKEYHNDWAGVNSNNENLADDTYYYIIEISTLKNITGFIIIKRDK